MLTVTKTVYYCEFCKRHRLTKSSIEQHEPRCIYNPQRVCGWKLWYTDHRHVDIALLAQDVRKRTLSADDDVAWLREQTDGCPACMLAAFVQSGLGWNDREAFDYKAEVERCRDQEREYARRDLW